jgi:hypothetical protein
VTDTSILDAPMTKVDGELKPAGGVTGAGGIAVVEHNTDNTLATLRFRLPNVKMEAAEDAFEVDGRKFRAGTFIVRDGSAVMEQAKNLGIKVHSTASELKVKTHPVSVPRIALMHGWQNTQNDGWYRIAMDKLEVPYTYIADTKVRETPDLRAQFDVIIVPPTPPYSTLAGALRGIPMRGGPMPWKNSDEMKNLVADGIDSTDDMRGGLGYSGLANLEKFVSSGGLLVAIQNSSVLPVQGGMTDMVSIVDPRTLQAPGSVLLARVEDKKSPIAYGYDEELYVYFRQGPILRVSTGFAPEAPAEGGGRPSGRGSATDPDVIQGRQYREPEKPVKRTPKEQEFFIEEDSVDAARAALPPQSQWPRVVLRFAPEKDLLLSGMLVGASELAEKPVVIDVPHGKGHTVLFANNPMWRDETMGSFFLLFNAMMHFDQLDAGR